MISPARVLASRRALTKRIAEVGVHLHLMKKTAGYWYWTEVRQPGRFCGTPRCWKLRVKGFRPEEEA